MPWNGEAAAAGEGGGGSGGRGGSGGSGGSGGCHSPTTTAPAVYSLRSRRVVKNAPADNVYSLRSRNVMKKHEPSKPKPKPKPTKFKPSKALREEILSLVEKPKPGDSPDMVTYNVFLDLDSDLDSDSDSSHGLSPVPAAEFPLSSSKPSMFTPRRPLTPKVLDCTGPSLKQLTQSNMKKAYTVMAKLALEYYNFKQHANLKLVQVIVASKDSDSVTKMHINFIASSDGHSQSLLFAELRNNCNILEAELSEYYVQGCCVMEKVDFGNPLGRRCSVCTKEVLHPGPAFGYRIVSGDVFQGSEFWEYLPCAYELSGPRLGPIHSANSKNSALFVVSAKKALEYFNSKQQQLAKFKDAKVTAGADGFSNDYGTVVHINFTAQLLSGSEQEFFFAVVSIPPFDIDRGWEDWKEPFVKVEACCRLEKVDSGNPFGRGCRLCRIFSFGTVIHPSPRDGHTSADGDDFAGYDFMNMSTGIY